MDQSTGAINMNNSYNNTMKIMIDEEVKYKNKIEVAKGNLSLSEIK